MFIPLYQVCAYYPYGVPLAIEEKYSNRPQELWEFSGEYLGKAIYSYYPTFKVEDVARGYGGVFDGFKIPFPEYVRMILRPLTDIPDLKVSENIYIRNYILRNYESIQKDNIPLIVANYLLENHIDIFGLIDQKKALNRNLFNSIK